MRSIFVKASDVPGPVGKQLKRVDPVPTVSLFVKGECRPVKMGADCSTMADFSDRLASCYINPIAAVAG